MGAILQRWLTQWQKWIGDIDPHSLNGVQLEAYQHHLLKLIADKKTSQATAKSTLAVMKQFLHWLYRSEIIDHLPRNIDQVNIIFSPQERLRHSRLNTSRPYWGRQRQGRNCIF